MKYFLVFLFLPAVYLTAQAPQFNCFVIPKEPMPGETVTVAIAGNATEAVLLAEGKQQKRVNFFPVTNDDKTFLAAVFTIPSTIMQVTATIRLENEKKSVGEISIRIKDRKFETETIELDPVLTGIREDYDPQKTAEAILLNNIINSIGKEIYHFGPFVKPVTSDRRTSIYGAKRIYKYSNGGQAASIHAGVDFGIITGTNVISCGAGKVVLARSRIVTGNSVIIEHLPGLYSLYYHLSEINVKEGDIVQTGELLGLSGATGLATGPHLHWEVRVNGENADPDTFISRPILDKNQIFITLFN
jgi:murein DD-endopeptidase MepM/ murein hydrolase activator NlpD